MKRCGVLWAVWFHLRVEGGEPAKLPQSRVGTQKPGQNRPPILLSNRLGGWSALPAHQGLSLLRSPTW